MYLSLGEHVEAGRIFEALLAGKTSEAVRNKAWFYLGKVWYQRGYLQESERALRQVSDKIQPRISAERYMLLAQLMLRQGRYDDAIAALSNWHGAPDWTAYAQFNLGVALVRKGPAGRGHRGISTGWARMETRSEELLSLQGQGESRAGLRAAAGAARRRGQADPGAGAPRRPVLEQGAARRRLGGLRASANSSARWCPGSRCASATCSTRRCRSPISRCPMPTISCGASGQAAEYYNSAIESFDAESKHIDDSIEQIRSGKLLDRLLNDDKKDTLTWYWQLKTLPDAPESRYLYQLLASNEFQEGLKNYRELNFMSRNLDDWREDVSAYDDMLDTRQEAYNERVPKADAVMAATDLDAPDPASASISNRGSTTSKSPTTWRRSARRRSSRPGRA